MAARCVWRYLRCGRQSELEPLQKVYEGKRSTFFVKYHQAMEVRSPWFRLKIGTPLNEVLDFFLEYMACGKYISVFCTMTNRNMRGTILQ